MNLLKTYTTLKHNSLIPGTNDWPGDATGTAQSLLGADKHVGNILVLAEQWDVQQNLQGLAVGGQHNELGLSTVQGLGGLVGSLSDLLVVAGLLNQVDGKKARVAATVRTKATHAQWDEFDQSAVQDTIKFGRELIKKLLE